MEKGLFCWLQHFLTKNVDEAYIYFTFNMFSKCIHDKNLTHFKTYEHYFKNVSDRMGAIYI